MPRKEYLSQEARHRFDHPPVLNSEQRLLFLQSPVCANDYIKTLQTPTTKVGVLQTSDAKAKTEMIELTGEILTLLGL